MSVFRYEFHKILEQERERLFLWCPVVFAFGILCYFQLRFEPSIWWSLAIIETMIVLAFIWRHQYENLVRLGWCALFVLGFVNIQVRAYHLAHVPLLKNEITTYLKGYVENSGFNYRGRRYLIMSHVRDFEDQPIAGEYRITLMQPSSSIVSGECVETVATLRPLMLPNMINGYQFNRQQFFQGIKATGYTDVSVHQIDCSTIGVKPSFWLPKIEKIRHLLVEKIYRVLPSSTAGIAAAVIAGERGYISLQQTAEYRDAGLAHFLAISGLHMGMIAGLMFWLIRSIAACIPYIALRYDTKKIAAAVAIIMSFIYLLISGWQISTQRAFIMTALVLFGVLIGRRAISMRMLAWAALIILILEPQVILSAGFQMSFAAVIMLVSFYERHIFTFNVSRSSKGIVKFCKIVVFYLAGIVVADFIASLATLPFVIYHFNRISVYTSIANFFAGPIIGLWIMPAVLFSLLLMPFGLGKGALWLVGSGIEQVNKIVSFVSHLDYASYQVLSMPSWGLILIVFGGLWLAIWQQKWRYYGWFFIIFGFLSIWTVQVPDVMIDNEAKTFAVKNNTGNMVILPNRGNYFTKQMWQEKLALVSLSQEERKKLTAIYQGKLNDTRFLSLKCHKQECVYKGKVAMQKKGGLKLDHKDLSHLGALAIYHLDTQPVIKTVKSKMGHRYWIPDFNLE